MNCSTEVAHPEPRDLGCYSGYFSCWAWVTPFQASPGKVSPITLESPLEKSGAVRRWQPTPAATLQWTSGQDANSICLEHVKTCPSVGPVQAWLA